MSTQTEGLRRFVAQRAPEPWSSATGRTIVIGSGKGGSGSSTVAALLAMATAQDGRRTLLVDGDDAIGALHHYFGTSPAELTGGLGGRAAPRDEEVVWIAETLALLPGGSASHRVHAGELSPAARRAYYRRIAPLVREFELVVIDAGSRLDGVMAAAGPNVWRYLAVSGVEPASLASSYALVKALESRMPGAPVELLINGHDDARGREAYAQVLAATERFLGRRLGYAGTIPECSEVRAAILAGQPLDQMPSRARASLASQLLAARLLAELDADGTPPVHSSRTLSWRS